MKSKEEVDRQVGLNRLYKLFLRYEERTRQGVADGFLFFNEDQVIQHAGKLAHWHLESEGREPARQ